MSAAHKYAVQMLLKVFGLNFEELENQAMQIQDVVMKFNPAELQAGLQMVLDYRKNQEQNEMRLKAILQHLDIADPCENSFTPTEDNPEWIRSRSTVL